MKQVSLYWPRTLLLQVLYTVVFSFAAASTFGFVTAWSGPSGTPPASNYALPIHTGGAAQTKSGALGVTSLTTSNNIVIGSATFYTNGDIYMPWASNYLSTMISSGNIGHKSGGSYTTNGGGGCVVANSLTGACSCPAWAPTATYVTNQPNNTGTWYGGLVCVGS